MVFPVNWTNFTSSLWKWLKIDLQPPREMAYERISGISIEIRATNAPVLYMCPAAKGEKLRLSSKTLLRYPKKGKRVCCVTRESSLCCQRQRFFVTCFGRISASIKHLLAPICTIFHRLSVSYFLFLSLLDSTIQERGARTKDANHLHICLSISLVWSIPRIASLASIPAFVRRLFPTTLAYPLQKLPCLHIPPSIRADSHRSNSIRLSRHLDPSVPFSFVAKHPFGGFSNNLHPSLSLETSIQLKVIPPLPVDSFGSLSI